MVIQPNISWHYLPPADHLAAIGAIAATWTIIEIIMETTILGLYEIDAERGLVLTNNLSFHARMSLLRILAGEGVIRDPAMAGEMTAILARVDDGFGERNTIVHGLWKPSDAPDITRRVSIRARGKKLRAISMNYSVADLQAIVERLRDLAKDFADLAYRLKIEELLAAAPRHSSVSNPSASK